MEDVRCTWFVVSFGSWKKTVKVYAWRSKSRAGLCQTHTQWSHQLFIQQKIRIQNHHQNFLISIIFHQILHFTNSNPFPCILLSLFYRQDSSQPFFSQTSRAGLWALEVARPRGKDNSKEAPAWWTKAVHGTPKRTKIKISGERFLIQTAFLVDDDISLWWWQWC